MACLSEETLLALACGSLEGEGLSQAVEHLDACADCRQLAALLARGDSPAEPSPATSPRTLGRYLLLNVLGAGAMGVVYRAYDPELDRKIALKVLRPDAASGTHPTEGRARLQKEAQAMARLAHPNVIAVHDVGSIGDEVFIAMELVDGPTVRAWLAQERRSQADIVDLFLQAGRGLAAAHAAGLVHRDFKPENVLVASDGRARVTDFGLARPETSLAPSTAGTPAYMAPEQIAGSADARSDQFGFCVSLWEALFGERPFAGDTPQALAEAVARGKVRAVPASARVPVWLRRALEKGLAPNPEARFASMDELLDLLGRDRGRRSRSLAVGLTVGAAAVLVALVFGLAATQARRCQGADARLSGIWDSSRRQQVEQAFASTGKPFAADAFKSTSASLDVWAAAWTAMRTDACLATRVRGEQSEELLDLRMACLDRKLEELAALTTLFVGATPAVVERAAEASASLGDLKECADRERLVASGSPPDAVTREKVEAVRKTLAQAKAHRDAGSYSRSAEIAGSALAAAQGSGFPPVVAEVQYALGDAQAKAGSYAAAEQILREAFAGAEGGRIDELAERASLRLAQVIGGNQQRFGEASVWADLAAAKAERLGGRAELRGAVAYARAMLLQRQGRWTESLARCREALPLLESAHGAQSPRVAEVERLMGSLMLEDGNLDEARAHHQRAFAIWSAALGTSHPDVAMSLNSLGHVQAAAGDLEGAQQTHRRALAIARAALGDEHPYVANALHNVAMVALAMGNLDEAEASLVRALQIRIKAYGPDHPLTAGTQGTQGELAMRRGRPSEALELHQRSLAALQKTLPADHPGLAAPLIGIGLAQLELGATKPAREALEQALRLRSEHPGEPARLATARFALARILATEDLPRALALAQQAREGFASIKDGRAAEVERWISAP